MSSIPQHLVLRSRIPENLIIPICARLNVDEEAQLLIIFRREEQCDFEGAILTADKSQRKIAGMG
jgi:hypothetical protein